MTRSAGGLKGRPLDPDHPLTERDLLHQVEVAGKELAPQRVVQVEGHAVAAHGVVRLLPAVPECLVSRLVLEGGRRAAALILQRNLHELSLKERWWRGDVLAIPPAAAKSVRLSVLLSSDSALRTPCQIYGSPADREGEERLKLSCKFQQHPSVHTSDLQPLQPYNDVLKLAASSHVCIHDSSGGTEQSQNLGCKSTYLSSLAENSAGKEQLHLPI